MFFSRIIQQKFKPRELQVSKEYLETFFSDPVKNLQTYRESVNPIYSYENDYEMKRIFIQGKPGYPTVYFIHGLGATFNFYFEGILLLASLGYTVFAHSRRGEVSAEDNLDNLSVELMVSDMVKQLHKYKIKKFHIIASSFGGILGLKIASVLKKNVLSVSTIGSFLKLPWGSAHEIVYKFLKEVNPVRLPVKNLGPFMPPIQFIKQRSPRLMDFILEEYGTLPVKGIIAYFGVVRKMNYLDRPPHLESPHLFLHGRFDDMVPISCYNDLQLRYPECSSTLLENTGHGPFLSLPVDYYNENLKFIAKHA